ncbi:Pertussis toxin liberation protein H [Methanoculleus chikugoensis]|uniref:Pertussis toxin liberation protein H n=1 Tax=Methanoculleus chikugoensis TaxID=118126 RepID=A0A1M4MH58_9EURY|nr:type II/IV secretion system ATPase subunit [Methanoculleus chikugoensis]SCL74237.1 Pertussis toxin liberation protein H [Methanoculleus chikugoensis]
MLQRREQGSTEEAYGATPTAGLRIPGSIKALTERFRHRDQGSTEENGSIPNGGVPSRILGGVKTLAARFRARDAPGAEIAFDSLALPSAGDGTVNTYWLDPGFSYAVVTRDKNSSLKYEVFEPALEPSEYILLNEAHDYIRDVFLFDSPREKNEISLTYDDVVPILRRFAPKLAKDRIAVLYYYLKRNFQGFGRIEPLMHDDYLEDISCNGVGVPVYVYHRLYESMPTNITFKGDELNRFVLKIAQKADRQISLTTPLVDASLPDGSRIQLTFSDIVSTRGSSFTVRKFRKDPMTPVSLIEYGTYSPEVLACIWLAVENRKSMIVVGGTASGKTSTMNAISFFIPHHSKIVSIEDTREIQLPHENWLPTQTREINVRGSRGDVDMFALLKAALRQRPEFIIVGEVRGREAQTLFQAMNTGHTTFSTLHAGSIDEAINRLVSDPINVPTAMLGALDLMVIQSLHYLNDGTARRCDSLHEIRVEQGREIVHDCLYRWDPLTDEFHRESSGSHVLDDIARRRGWSADELERELARRAEFLARIHANGGIGVDDLIRRIAAFGGGADVGPE